MVGRLEPMTTHRAPQTVSHSAQLGDRAVTGALVLAVLAGLAWLGGMIATVVGWAF